MVRKRRSRLGNPLVMWMRVADDQMWVISTVDLGEEALVERDKVINFIKTAAHTGIQRMQWVGWSPPREDYKKGDGLSKKILEGLDREEWDWFLPLIDNTRAAQMDYDSFQSFVVMLRGIFGEKSDPASWHP